MDKAKKQEFTRRISSSNRGGMIVVIYDIYFAYQQEALQWFEKGELKEYRAALRKAQQAVAVLRNALDFSYPIAKELYPLYQYAIRQLSTGFYRQDTSEPLMKHTQQIVAGMTYQRGNLTETIQDSMSSRGFFA